MSLSPRQTTLYASAARTATPTTVTFATSGAGHLHVVINVTVYSAAASVVPTIDAQDATSGAWYNLLTGAAIVATGVTVLKVGPGITAVANAAAADILPETLRVVMTHGNTDSITYSVGAHLLG